ncbi:MAG: ABC-ATPase domain-containing protein [Lachnospiraceae bacterium]|nr:ABC-ATPase domain-containing protein [Lachnospiraceae bacterium]MCI8987110.1 ABC-ATPase domain-containing protein [Lachnospiraceae bacterium]
MNTATELRNKLRSIDHKGYPAYKDLKGQYNFGDYVLSIDHVQGDPFASPSRLSVRVEKAKAGFPAAYYDTKAKRITLQDHLTRLFGRQVAGGSFQAKGSGKSGLLSVSRCGQQVLERTAMRVKDGDLILRFEAGFPANGRTINARELEKMLFDILPDCVRRSLYYGKIDKEKLRQAICLCEDQQYIRQCLTERKLCAFIADGSVLPRESGVSERPMKNGVPFRSPESLRITLDLPNKGAVSGMGIPQGITLFVGGGYHGKSTILQALQNGVYDHIAGDGRELVITDASAFKLRAEDGRSVTGVDISPFIKNLPNRKDTVHFSTEDASGSTSQAANLMEALESGSSLILIDEDTSATNFMVRDRLMAQVITPGEEPITPFISRVRGMYEDLGVSSVIVAGSSGAFFHMADTIIQMKEYVPIDITQKAKEAAAAYEDRGAEDAEDARKFPPFNRKRCPGPDMALRKEDRIKMKAMGTSEISICKENVELRYLEQLKDQEQSMALAYLLKYAQLKMMDGRKDLRQIGDLLEEQLDGSGLESLFERGDVSSQLARPRKQEILACINRYRKLKI